METENLVLLEPLTREAFAPFGDVIETDGSHSFTINNGSTERFHDLASIDVAEAGGRPLVSIFRAQPLSQPVAVTMMERHPLASQAFIPLDGSPFLVVVAPAGPRVTPNGLRGFVSNGRQGVNYHRGVWHHPVLALKPDQDFLVIDRGGAGHNCDEFFFNDQDRVVLSEFQTRGPA